MSYNLSDVKINPANPYEEDDEDKQIPVKSPVETYEPRTKQEPAKLSILGRLPGEAPTTTRGQNLAIDTAKAILPDPTNIAEIAQEFTELASDIWKTKNPYRGGAWYVTKKLIKNSPEAARALKIAKEAVSPYIQKAKTWLQEDQLEPVYAGIENLTGIQRRVVNPAEPLKIKGDGSWPGRGKQPPKNKTANKLWRLEGEIDDSIKAKELGYTPENIEKGLSKKATKIEPKTNALNRYDEFKQKGYEIPEPLRNQAEAIRNPNYTTKLKGIKQWDNKDAYIKAAQKHYDDTGISTDIRTKIGVYVDENGEVYQMMSRKKGDKLSFRSWSEKANTDLNRKLSLFQQQGANIPAYDSAENVSKLMKQMNFKGTAKEFKAKYAIHHRRSIVAYEPFFHGLNGKEAAELRKLLEADGIKLGDHIDNLVAIPKRMHTVDKQSIHTLMRKNAIEGRSKDWEGIAGSYDAQANLRKRFADASVQGRHEAIKIYQEYVQQPTDDMLQKILDTLD